jgi:hypothetical protein
VNQYAVTAIRSLLEETNQRQGWQIPDMVTEYLALLFAEKIDKNPWQPEPSYAEQFMTLKSARAALALGNTCFFTRSVFPELKQRRGINMSYYTQLGQSCYAWAVKAGTAPAVEIINRHFDFLAECSYTAIRLNQEFRSMWDLD